MSKRQFSRKGTCMSAKAQLYVAGPRRQRDWQCADDAIVQDKELSNLHLSASGTLAALVCHGLRIMRCVLRGRSATLAWRKRMQGNPQSGCALS